MICNGLKRSVPFPIRLPSTFYLVHRPRNFAGREELVWAFYTLSFLTVWVYVSSSVMYGLLV